MSALALLWVSALALGCAGAQLSAPAPEPVKKLEVDRAPVLNEPEAAESSASPAPADVPPAASPAVSEVEQRAHERIVKEWCQKVAAEFRLQGWKPFPCPAKTLKIGGYSVQGQPIMVHEYGSPSAKNTTLVFSAVHGDEIVPLYISMRMLYWLSQNEAAFPDTYIVVAPLVNPDGTFSTPKTRTNANKVDVNRNFPTADWESDALSKWKKDFKSAPRRYPGEKPNSEPETDFQIKLIERIKPNKILSIHAPLNMIDYDGPNVLLLERFSKEYVHKCLELSKQLRARSAGFFPGSLGNYAGQERGIPTITLELPTANPKMAESYWWKFKEGIKKVIQFTVPEHSTVQAKSP